MKPQIRINKVEGNTFELDLVWDKGDKSFELPRTDLEVEPKEEYHYFWYFSDGSYSTDPNASLSLEPSTNQVYESGLILERKKKKPVVRGKTSPIPEPPVESPYGSGAQHLYVPGSDLSRNSTESTLSPLELEIVIQDNLVVGVLHYTRLADLNIPDTNYLRISFNQTKNTISPLLFRQNPISFHEEWIDLASPSEGYSQAIYMGFNQSEINSRRTIFLPFWGIFEEDDKNQTKLDLTDEILVEWMKEEEDELSPISAIKLKMPQPEAVIP